MPKRTTPGDEEFSKLRERWHLEQRTISKEDTGQAESEDERGVMPPEGLFEDVSWSGTVVELILGAQSGWKRKVVEGALGRV